jgi:hypothetical protein
VVYGIEGVGLIGRCGIWHRGNGFNRYQVFLHVGEVLVPVGVSSRVVQSVHLGGFNMCLIHI